MRRSHIPADIYAGWDARERGADARSTAGKQAMAGLRRRPPGTGRASCAAVSPASCRPTLAEQAEAYIASARQEGASIASRKASQNCLNAYGPLLPELLGGSADLAGSNLTLWSGSRGIGRR